jgi:2-oxo-4-hydroxy-4-carboxy--5-ureidoimidazoline (OHCU) decarboxylase
MAVFERSPELVSRLIPLVRPDDTPEDVVRRARGVIDMLPERERVATLNAHPRIGDDVRALSELSLREQGADQTPRTMAELKTLNDEYERRFGFRFVVFVNGRSKAQLVPVLRDRLTRTRESELRTGIEEFLAISLDRLARARDDETVRKAMDVDS